MLRCFLQTLNLLSNRVTFTAIVPARGDPGKAKCGKNRFKKLIHFTTRHRYIAISQKWSKIDWYMQRGVLQALNPLFNRATFTAIVPEAYPGRPKCSEKGELLKLSVELLGNG